MDQQSVQLGIWIGVAVLALGWANLQIWRVRRALNPVRQVPPVPKHRSVPRRTGAISAAVELTSH